MNFLFRMLDLANTPTIIQNSNMIIMIMIYPSMTSMTPTFSKWFASRRSSMMPHHNTMINVLSLTLHHHDHQHHGHQEHSRNILWPFLVFAWFIITMQYVIHVLLVSLTLHHQHTKAINKNIQTSGHPCCNHRPSNDTSQHHPPPAAPQTPNDQAKQELTTLTLPHTICQQWLLFLHHYDSNSNIWPLVLVAITARTASHYPPLQLQQESPAFVMNLNMIPSLPFL